MLYDFLKVILLNIFLRLFHCKVLGKENIPKQGGVIIAANHVSLWDPPLVAAFVPRYVHFMAKEELFKITIFGYIIKKLHSFPVRRGASDRSAIRTAISLLTEGHCLGLFPEGTRSKNGMIRKPEAGLALIALKAGVPVIPTAIIGTNKIFKKGSFLPDLEVRFGRPMTIHSEKADKSALQEFSQDIMNEIEYLMKE
ncbi:lysophospholipid acyltransferase family protein [Anaerosinus massiliensis]|uniref:lysophospholipid acyltransferase family protein n=1 Tax=Massilibacillus massiliensis TaxID=1806837 RepID=UPI000A708770|nr:lysophospholipid acyltransferase family protein [Massilibacillus massiliensis]